MFITVTKWFAVAMLLAAALLQPSGATSLLLQSVVSAGAIIVAVQAMRLQERIWAFGFIALALLFNPIFTIPFSGSVLRWLEVVCIACFLVSLVCLKPEPLRSVPSITNWRPGGESL
jgi:hypothetical protein